MMNETPHDPEQLTAPAAFSEALHEGSEADPATTNDARARPSRRAILLGLGALGLTGAATAAGFATVRHRTSAPPRSSTPTPAPTPTPTPTSAAATVGSTAPGILVLVTLYGGNDGLNTVVPYTDRLYYEGRGDLAIRPEEVLALDAQLGLNPGLGGFKQLWDAKHLAIVRGVGYPNPIRSHFRSMDIWQSAVPERDEPSGWLGRWLDATDHDPMRALAIGATVPRALRGVSRVAGAVPSGKFNLPAGAVLDTAFRTVAAVTGGDSSLAAAIEQSNHDLLTIQTQMARIGAAEAGSGTPSLEPEAATSAVNPLATQLAVVSQAIRSGASTRVYSVALGGFDTHAVERTAHIGLLRTLGDAVEQFLHGLDGHDAASNVVILMHSEFGRRVAANASGGTDHGTAAPVFLAGPGVRGGMFGDEPALTDLDQGDLRFTVDFRSVYATLLDKVLDADAVRILGGDFQPLALLS
jgi:uncharacterized protein (DUF1501 family)